MIVNPRTGAWGGCFNLKRVIRVASVRMPIEQSQRKLGN